MHTLNVYCIPGLGMTTRLFKDLRLPNCNIIYIKWISPLKNETLPEYAGRLSTQIDSSKPFVLIGVSFGGMLAIEIAKKLQPLQTILVSSSKVSAELPSQLLIFKYIPLHLALSDVMCLKLAWLIKNKLGVTKELEPVFKELLVLPPENYYSRAIHMILHWKNETVPSGVIHIHGNSDRILFYKKNIDYDHIIEDGTHFMILDRADEISKIIAEELNKYQRSGF